MRRRRCPLAPRRPPTPMVAAAAGSALGASLATSWVSTLALAALVVLASLAAGTVRSARAVRNTRRAARDHELRNIAGGLMAAHAVLGRPLPAKDWDVVRAGVAAELQRLWTLAGGTGAGPATHVDVGAVVTEATAARGHSCACVQVVGRPAVMCDDAALRSAVGDCLVNAERYAPGSAVTVVVRTAGHRVRIDITDRGPAPGRSPHPPGTGRGLEHAGQVLERFGGSVSLRRAADGAVARIELPLAAPLSRSWPGPRRAAS